MTAVRSETAGSVIAVLITEGAHVAEGDELLITESMKMEVPILSPVTGTIQKLHVAEGATVDEDDIVAEIAADASEDPR